MDLYGFTGPQSAPLQSVCQSWQPDSTTYCQEGECESRQSFLSELVGLTVLSGGYNGLPDLAA